MELLIYKKKLFRLSQKRVEHELNKAVEDEYNDIRTSDICRYCEFEESVIEEYTDSFEMQSVMDIFDFQYGCSVHLKEVGIKAMSNDKIVKTQTLFFKQLQRNSRYDQFFKKKFEIFLRKLSMMQYFFPLVWTICMHILLTVRHNIGEQIIQK